MFLEFKQLNMIPMNQIQCQCVYIFGIYMPNWGTSPLKNMLRQYHSIPILDSEGTYGGCLIDSRVAVVVKNVMYPAHLSIIM